MNQLVLFDIDGTLVYHVGTGVNIGIERFRNAIRSAFHKTVEFDTSKNYNGWIDRQITWDVISRYGITKEEFNRQFPKVAALLHEHALEQERASTGKLYAAIPDAVKLAELLESSGVCLGIMTGNVERVGKWKLVHAGIPDIFRFGLYGDEADDRISLARKAYGKARDFFGTEFAPNDTTVIGDAVNDIRCAHAIGAASICVMTGGHTDVEELQREKPDILVDSLMDRAVLEFFQHRMVGFPAEMSI